MKHTPGPWRVHDGDLKHHYNVSQDNDDGSGVNVVRNIRKEANARLIAAAPDLLEACVEFVRKCECGEAKSVRSYAQMTTAIAKAKGES